MRLLELQQLLFVLGARRVEHAQHQHHGVFRHGDLDLRDALANRQLGKQFTERREQRADWRGQHFTALQLGNVAGEMLAEPDHGSSTRVHEAGAKARAPAVLPLRPGERRKPFARRNAADALQVFA